MEKNKWKIGTFFTENTPYEQVYLKYLRESLKKYNIPCLIDIIPNEGGWLKNVANKPAIIKRQLISMDKDECLVFLDADCTIEQYPILFDEIPKEYDIAFHTLSWSQWYGHSKDFKELLSGTMFFRNNEIVKRLCDAWYNESKKGLVWEQKALENIINIFDIKIYSLPLEYCYIKNRPGGLPPLVKLDPVILHHQVSREYKKSLIN